MNPTSYLITFSVATHRSDEKRFQVKVAANRLATKILALQSRPNTFIHSVEIAY